MTDLIDRAALMDDIEESVVFSGRNSRNAEVRSANKIIDRIKAAPAVDAEPVKHGRWEEWWPCICLIMTGEEMLYRCSVCDAKYADIEGKNYCPNCGAKMDLEVDEGL